MRSLCRFAPLVLLLLVMTGCAPIPHIGPEGSPNGTVMHVVVMWLYDPGDETAKNEVLAAGKVIQHLPGVVNVGAGTVVRSDRPVVDNSFDIAFVVTFRNEDDMRKYLENPQHVDLKKNVLDRYVKKYQVYDFKGE